MRDFDDNEFPLVYLITFRCYGTWLHGDERGSYRRNSRVMSDRKSTRLNSSHSQISYAVFCLKKKKKSTRVQLSVNSCNTLTSSWQSPHSTVILDLGQGRPYLQPPPYALLIATPRNATH